MINSVDIKSLAALAGSLENIKDINGVSGRIKKLVIDALEGKTHINVIFDGIRNEVLGILEGEKESFGQKAIDFFKNVLRLKGVDFQLILKGRNKELAPEEMQKLSQEYIKIDKFEIRKFLFLIILRNIKLLFESPLENILYLFNKGRNLNIEVDRINRVLNSLTGEEKESILRILLSEEEILDENKKRLFSEIFGNFNELTGNVLGIEETDLQNIGIFLKTRIGSVIKGIGIDLSKKKSYEESLKNERIRTGAGKDLEFLGVGHRFDIIRRTKNQLGKYILFLVFFEGYIEFDFDDFVETTATRINIETRGSKGNIEEIKKEVIVELKDFLQIPLSRNKSNKEKKSFLEKGKDMVNKFLGKNVDSLYSKLSQLIGIDEESLKNIDNDEIIKIISKTKTYEGRKLIFNIFFVGIKNRKINYNLILDKLFIKGFITKGILLGKVENTFFNFLMQNALKNDFVDKFLYILENSYIFNSNTIFSVEFIQLILDDDKKESENKIEHKLSRLPRINGKVDLEEYFSSIRDTENKK